MGAYIISGIILVVTIIWSGLIFFADAMNDTTGNHGTTAGWWFLGGAMLSGAVLSTHFFSIGW